jgi:SSS family solute:Na+ symporter
VNIGVVAIVVVYLAAMHGVAWWASRRIKSNEDFMVAGRRLGPWMVAGSLAATEVGGGSSLGVTGKAYGAWGLSAAWYVLALAVTFVLLGLIAPALRAAMVKTVPEFFRARYGPVNGIVTALVLILPLIGLTAVQLMASATILSVMTGLSYTVSVVVVTVLVTEYSILGGLWSVTLTDVVQWVLIVAGSLLVIPFGLHAAGGLDEVLVHLPEEKTSFTAGIGWKTIAALVVMYFTSFAVGQEAVQRYYAARDARTARTGSLLAGAFYCLYALIPAFIGLIAFAMVQAGTLDASFIESHGTRYVLPTMAAQVLPTLVVGLLFAALISATMSSADSDLLAAGSIFANDIYREHLRPDATDAQVLRATRLTMFAVGVLSLAVALLDLQDLVAVLMFCFALRAGGEFVPYVVGHFWQRASAQAALGSIIAGCAAVIAVQVGWLDVWGLDAAIVGVVVNAVTFFGLSWIFPRAR